VRPSSSRPSSVMTSMAWQPGQRSFLPSAPSGVFSFLSQLGQADMAMSFSRVESGYYQVSAIREASIRIDTVPPACEPGKKQDQNKPSFRPACDTLMPLSRTTVPDSQGRFGAYGGRYVPETLMHTLRQLSEEYDRARRDPAFQEQLNHFFQQY